MFTGADYYIRHPQDEEPTKIASGEMALNRLENLVDEMSTSNDEHRAEAIRRADSFSFQTVHPELLPTENNKRLIDNWLQTQSITNPTYPDFEAALEAYKDSKLLDLDPAELARDRSNVSYRGVLSNQTCYSVDDLIMAERQAALTFVPIVSDEELALEQLPIEEAQALLKQAENNSRRVANRSVIQDTADAWLLHHPEFVDSTRNAKLLNAQLKISGVTDPAIADFEKAAGQLRANGMLRLNQNALNKQHEAKLAKQADEAFKSLHDETSEQEMYQLPLEELRR